MELIFCLGVACVYLAAGMIVAIGLDYVIDLREDFMIGACIILWPIFLFIELFRRKK